MNRKTFENMRASAYATQEAEWRRQRDGYDAKHEAMRADRANIMSWLRPMQPWEYSAWLTRYLEAGGKVTHYYQYPTPIDCWLTALTHFEIRPLYGALSLNIIVPEGIAVSGDTGHTNLYVTSKARSLFQGFHDRQPRAEASLVPVYSDTELLGQ